MPRRGHNEGTICQRADGRWVGAINLGYETNSKTGKKQRKRKYIYGRTRKEVADKMKLALADQQKGLPIALERQTVGHFLTHWLEHSAKNSLRASTFASYENHIRNHLSPTLSHIQLQQLGPQHIQALLNDKLASGLSPRTVLYTHAVLRRALGQALRWGLVSRNVASLVEPPRAKPSEIKPWTPEQARAFLQAVKGDRLEALYSVALALGLRRGEALGLRWEDVDFDNGTLTVRAALQRIKGKLQLVEPKTERSRRSILLPDSSVAALKSHRLRQLEDRLLAGSKWQDSGMLFTSTIGTPLEPRNVNRSFYKATAAAGLPRIRFHDLRHTCATLLLVQGVQPRVVMEVLGHSRIAVTMDIYSHVLPVLQRDAADKMELALFGS